MPVCSDPPMLDTVMVEASVAWMSEATSGVFIPCDSRISLRSCGLLARMRAALCDAIRAPSVNDTVSRGFCQSESARRMGGAKRRPSIAVYDVDGFRKGLNLSYVLKSTLV